MIKMSLMTLFLFVFLPFESASADGLVLHLGQGAVKEKLSINANAELSSKLDSGMVYGAQYFKEDLWRTKDLSFGLSASGFHNQTFLLGGVIKQDYFIFIPQLGIGVNSISIEGKGTFPANNQNLKYNFGFVAGLQGVYQYRDFLFSLQVNSNNLASIGLGFAF